MLYNQVISGKKFVLTEQKQKEISVFYPTLFHFFNDGFKKKWISVVPSVMKDLPNLTGKCEIRIFRTNIVIDKEGTLYLENQYPKQKQAMIIDILKYPFIKGLQLTKRTNIHEGILIKGLTNLNFIKSLCYFPYQDLVISNRLTLKHIDLFDVSYNRDIRFPKLVDINIDCIQDIDNYITYDNLPLLLIMETRNGQPYEHPVVTNNNKKIKAFVTILLYMNFLRFPKDVLRLIGSLSSRLSSEYWEDKQIIIKKRKLYKL